MKFHKFVRTDLSYITSVPLNLVIIYKLIHHLEYENSENRGDDSVLKKKIEDNNLFLWLNEYLGIFSTKTTFHLLI